MHHSAACERIGYNTTKFPNVFGHQTYDEAILVYYSLIYFFPTTACESLYTDLVCGALFPKCNNGTAKQICRQSCLGSISMKLQRILKRNKFSLA